MISAFQLIFSGGIYIPPEILSSDEIPPTIPVPQRSDRPILLPSEIGLSDRRLRVLAPLIQGKSNKIICRMLNLTEATVKRDIAFILKALKVENRTQAVVAASELGWKFPAAPEA